MRQVWLLLPFVNMSLAWSEDGPPGQTRSEWTGLEPLVAMESGKPRPNGTRRIVVSWGSTGPWRSTDLQSIESRKNGI
jgi:hypothetical protein